MTIAFTFQLMTNIDDEIFTNFLEANFNQKADKKLSFTIIDHANYFVLRYLTFLIEL